MSCICHGTKVQSPCVSYLVSFTDVRHFRTGQVWSVTETKEVQSRAKDPLSSPNSLKHLEQPGGEDDSCIEPVVSCSLEISSTKRPFLEGSVLALSRILTLMFLHSFILGMSKLSKPCYITFLDSDTETTDKQRVCASTRKEQLITTTL